MHQTVKLIYRLFFAAVIFVITLSLLMTCVSKINDIIHADEKYQQAQTLSLTSSAKEQFVLVSNNQKPDNALFVLIAGNGYIAKSSCEHYTKLCSNDDNQTHSRQINTVDLIKIGQSSYIQHVNYVDTRTGQTSDFTFSEKEIQQFYQNDIHNLKYVVFGVGLFALAALFISFKILKNFRRFIGK